jgi:hypothetical protein
MWGKNNKTGACRGLDIDLQSVPAHICPCCIPDKLVDAFCFEMKNVL